MNKKQLIVAWVMAIVISLVLLDSSIQIKKVRVYKPPTQEEIERAGAEKGRQKGITTFDDIRSKWTGKYKKVIKKVDIKGVILIVLILGGLGVYTLKDKKK